MASSQDAVSRLNAGLAGRYRIKREIGEGGMATVYLAQDLKHDRAVALKVLKPELAALMGGERFLTEIKTTANLQHPHILPLFDSGEADGFLYYVMPFIEGESLREKMAREKQVEVEEAVGITKQVAAALEYAHRQGIVHRDVKPENILLHHREALVADFGIALAFSGEGAERLTLTGCFVGTPEYMSPEQATGEGAIDGRADLYALACVLYEMLAGEPPYTGPTAQAIITKRFVDPVPAVRRVRNTVPAGVEVALLKALATVPADRFPTVGSFAKALDLDVAPRPTTRSVAVLPFLNLSPDPENEYFADGITEDVIAQLTKIRALKVISRTSVMRFKKHEEGLSEIGRTLGVETLLKGSVRRSGDRVRVVAQLVDVETDQHLWADTFDHRLRDIFAIQSAVALRIAEALRTELSPDERARIGKEPTDNLEAYHLYLKGRRCHHRLTEEGLNTALGYYREANAKDPGYALAHAGSALAYLVLGLGFGSGTMRPVEAYTEAKAAVARALAADDSLGDAHSVLGLIKVVVDFDWVGAEREFQRALELNPGSADTYDAYGLMLAAQERHDEAIAMRRRAQELDPLAPVVSSDLATSFLRAGRYGEALREAQRLLDFEPDLPTAHSTLAWALLFTGKHDAGLAELRKAAQLSSGSTMFLAQLGQAYAFAGRPENARGVLRQLEDLARAQYVPPYHLAYVYAGLGDQDKAMDCLDRAYEEHAGGIYGVKGSFLFATLRSHPRFQALLAKIDLA